MSRPWWENEPQTTNRRQVLPHTDPSLPSPRDNWKIVKHMITGDSLDFPIPAQMCLPITELQRRAEELEFSELLDQAALKPKGSVERLLLVAAFAQSAFHAVGKLKPMVPVMGETYELVLPEKRMRLLVEMTYLSLQEERGIVSWVAEGERWRLEGEDEPKLRFRATSIEMRLNWLDTLTFSDGDMYTWKKLTTGCASVSFLNGMAPAFHGTILVQNPGHKQSVTLEFQERSAWQVLASNRGVKDGMFGYVERDGRRLDMPFLSGSWRSRLVADMPDGSHWTVFEVNPLPSGPNRLGLNVRSMQLNEIAPGLEARLPPTDTRWRRDLRALETGDYAEAARLFGLLDQRWRDRAMQLNKLTGATSLLPTWFTLREPDGLEGPRGEESRYRYKGGYWEARATGDWSAIPPEVQQSCAV